MGLFHPVPKTTNVLSTMENNAYPSLRSSTIHSFLHSTSAKQFLLLLVLKTWMCSNAVDIQGINLSTVQSWCLLLLDFFHLRNMKRTNTENHTKLNQALQD